MIIRFNSMRGVACYPINELELSLDLFLNQGVLQKVAASFEDDFDLIKRLPENLCIFLVAERLTKYSHVIVQLFKNAKVLRK